MFQVLDIYSTFPLVYLNFLKYIIGKCIALLLGFPWDIHDEAALFSEEGDQEKYMHWN